MGPSPRQQFIEAYTREHRATLGVLCSYPPDQLELRPHSRCKTAGELAWTLVAGQGLCMQVLSAGFDGALPPSVPGRRASLVEVRTAFERGRDPLMNLVAGRDQDLSGVVRFPTGPRRVDDVPVAEFLWLMLCDQIQCRAQFAICLRLAGHRAADAARGQPRWSAALS
jgi:hypothetical protein